MVFTPSYFSGNAFSLAVMHSLCASASRQNFPRNDTFHHRCTLLHALDPSGMVPLPAFMALSATVLYLEMASYGKWLFDQTGGLSRANPSYQLAVVGNFLIARLGTQVCAALL